MRDATDRVIRRYFDEGELADGLALYYARDHLGSVRDVVGAGGTTLASYDYDPYGQPVRTEGATPTHRRYAGMYYHPPSGLYLTHYRAYDPASGRWLSRDPIGEVGGVNLYAYVENNPLLFTDPMGLDKTVTITEGTESGIYGASVTVDDSDCGCQTFSGRGSSLPNSPVRHNTAAAGTYSGTNTTRASGTPGIYIG